MNPLHIRLIELFEADPTGSVAADLLEESGMPNYAEYVRVECTKKNTYLPKRWMRLEPYYQYIEYFTNPTAIAVEEWNSYVISMRQLHEGEEEDE